MPLSNKLLILVIIVTLIAAPIIFLKNPLDAAYCLMSGDEWARQGLTGRYCHKIMSDGGTLCSTNNGCKSGKCVIGVNKVFTAFTAEGQEREVTQANLSTSFNTLLSDDIMGRCSPDNKDTCYSGEMTVNEYRVVVTPVMCE